MPAHTPSSAIGPAGQTACSPGTPSPSRAQSCASTDRGIVEQLFGVQDGRLLPDLPQIAVKLRLQREPRIAQRGRLQSLRQRRQHLLRVADEQHVDRVSPESRADVHQVVRHLLHEEHGPVARAEDHVANHTLAVRVHGRHHLLRAGMRGIARRAGSGRRAARPRTRVSLRRAKAYISAVETLRGPDQMLMRLTELRHGCSRSSRVQGVQGVEVRTAARRDLNG